MPCCGEPLIDLGAFVGIEVGAGVGDHGDLLLVEHPGGEHLPDQGVAGVQIPRDADPLATLVRGDPAGEPDLVGDHPLHLRRIVHTRVDLLGRDGPSERKNRVGLPCGDGVLLLFELRDSLCELRGEEAWDMP